MLRMAVARARPHLAAYSDTLYTSSFMDDVIFAHKLDVAAQQKRSAHAALGLAISCAKSYQLQANGRTGLLFGRL